MSPLSSQWAENIAATASPVPLGAISKPIKGVETRHAASRLTATISTWSSGASARRRLVIKASRGPPSRLRAAASASSMVEILLPTRCFRPAGQFHGKTSAESLAHAFFWRQNPIGKTLTFPAGPAIIIGVARNPKGIV